jgi:hypothetical protein
MPFRHGDGEFLNLAGPDRLSPAPFKRQRESSDAIEEACHCDGTFVLSAYSSGEVFPERQRNRITQGLVAWRISIFVFLAFAFDP